MSLPLSNEKKFSIAIKVQNGDIDELGHVNNVVYMQWVQDVAAAHWNSLASVEIRQRYSWVVIRHEIDYIGSGFEGDHLKATTWVGESRGARSERHVEITNQANGKLLVKAKTTWCLLDDITMKPKRVDEEMIAMLNGSQ